MSRVPVTVLTGFLGAGKTTLLRSLLTQADGRRIAVIVNEFGDAGFDGGLVEELRGQPGTRVPHVWVRNGVSTLDLLGGGFTLLTGDERWCAAAASVSVAAHRIYSDEWAAMTGLSPEGALLVRPDDFVGWRADELPDDPEADLRQALSTILCR